MSTKPGLPKFNYPMSVFNYVFHDLTAATHLRISIPESTIVWLSQFAGDSRQHANFGCTPQENLFHRQDHRRLFYMLLRTVLPTDALDAINDVERAENMKNELVDKNQFDDAARWLHKRDSGFSALAEYVKRDSTVLPSHIEKLFDLLASGG